MVVVNTCERTKKLEIVDVDHHAYPNMKGSFFTTNFVKPTALNRNFLNGNSYHPTSVFKSIIFGEATRLRRINEKDDYYIKSLDGLKSKCLKSGFNKKIVDDMIGIVSSWKERFAPPTTKHQDMQDKKIWTTFFPSLLKLNKKEKMLAPNVGVVYRRSKTLGQSLTNYKHLARTQDAPTDGTSEACEHCSLCGHHGKHKTMIHKTNVVKSKTGRTFKIKQKINCKDSGIYVATCTKCEEQYVGQTGTTFTKRWNEHRSRWKKKVVENDDKAALLTHYAKAHANDMTIELHQAFYVTFAEKPRDLQFLDVLESRWINRLNAKINICKTVLPKFR